LLGQKVSWSSQRGFVLDERRFDLDESVPFVEESASRTENLHSLSNDCVNRIDDRHCCFDDSVSLLNNRDSLSYNRLDRLYDRDSFNSNSLC
jgi:hypothetical protein